MLSPVPSGASGKNLSARVRTGLRCLPSRHHQMSIGGVIEMPTYDRFGNLVCDQSGRPVTTRKLVMPNLRAIWRELALHDPETYGPQKKATVPEWPPPSQHARPRDLMPMLYSVVQRPKARGIDATPYARTQPPDSTQCDGARSGEIGRHGDFSRHGDVG